MEIAKWDDRYKTGYGPVDLQHQELFRLINDLHAAILAKRDKEILSATLEKLIRYTKQHFRAEEALMASVNYPHRTSHQHKHQQLTQEVEELREEYATGRAILSITLAMFLAKWFRHHIQEVDMALIKYIKASRVSESREPITAGR